MIEVELPDGRILEFPEGTSQDVMRSAIQKLEGQDAAMSDGLAELSAMTQNPQVLNTAQPDRGMLYNLVDNVVGIDDGYMSPGEKLGNLADLGGEALTFGLVGDEADARLRSAMGQGTYEEILQRNRAQEAQLREENPYMSAAAEILGGFAVPAGAVSRAPGLLSRIMKGSLVAGAGGATYGYMEGETLEERAAQARQGGIIGGLLGGLVPGAGYGIEKVVNRVRGNRAIRQAAQAAPTSQELAARAGSLFDEIDAQRVPADGLAPLADDIALQGRASGMDAMLTPNAQRVSDNIATLADDAGDALPMSELNILRRQAAVPAGNLANRTESAVGSQMIDAIDGYIDNVAPALGEKGAEARRMWGTLRRSELIDKAFERAGEAASGFENGLQIEFRKILRNDKLRRGFSDAEIRAIRSVVNGGVLHGLLRQVGRLGFSLDGGSNAVGGTFGTALGGMIGSWPGALLMTGVASGARKSSEVLRTAKANRAADLVRTLDQPQLPTVSTTGRGLIDEMLTRAARSAAMQAGR